MTAQNGNAPPNPRSVPMTGAFGSGFLGSPETHVNQMTSPSVQALSNAQTRIASGVMS